MKTQRSFCATAGAIAELNNSAACLAPPPAIVDSEKLARKHVMKKATSTRDFRDHCNPWQMRSSLEPRHHDEDEIDIQTRNLGTAKTSGKLKSFSTLINWIREPKKFKGRFQKTVAVPSDPSESGYAYTPKSSITILNRTRSETVPSFERPGGSQYLIKEKFRPMQSSNQKSSFKGKKLLLSGLRTESVEDGHDEKKDLLTTPPAKSSPREVSFDMSSPGSEEHGRSFELLAPQVEEAQPGPQRFLPRDTHQADDDDDRSSFHTLDGRDNDFDDQEVSLPRWPGSADS